MFDGKAHPHRRFNALTREWVLVSPQRTERPWQGQVEKLPGPEPPAYDAGCYLCPGNSRAGGHRNPSYETTFVFDNDFAALLPAAPEGVLAEGGLLRSEAESGVCRVVCFSPDHSMTLGRMTAAKIRPVVDAWVEQFGDLAARDGIGYVQIFENRGEMMGCSNPHPHGQIWATRSVPNEIEKETRAQQAYFERAGAALLDDYLKLELAKGERVVCENASFVAVAPFWAIWPFETLVLGRTPRTGIDELSEGERDGLADLLRRLTARYDNLFGVSFPYSMGIHQRPVDRGRYQDWRMHLHFYPPLLRSATVRKFMVGYELLAMPQRDITPEIAAERLRACSEEAPAPTAGKRAG
jgi:UDPglucose--hexose-1-phosphate uridylyltransferase